jgi:hypothetical protein
MMAEVGGIVNVNGKRMAILLAPPSQGNTPMITPSMTPTSINIMLKGVNATANPLYRADNSST